jgi:hypothetical protein
LTPKTSVEETGVKMYRTMYIPVNCEHPERTWEGNPTSESSAQRQKEIILCIRSQKGKMIKAVL